MLFALIMIAQTHNLGGISVLPIGDFPTLEACKNASTAYQQPVKVNGQNAIVEFICVQKK